MKELKAKIETTTVTRVKRSVSLDQRLVIALLRNAGIDVPANASVFVKVPGGGDWSNMALDIGIDTDIDIVWEVVDERVPAIPAR